MIFSVHPYDVLSSTISSVKLGRALDDLEGKVLQMDLLFQLH